MIQRAAYRDFGGRQWGHASGSRSEGRRRESGVVPVAAARSRPRLRLLLSRRTWCAEAQFDELLGLARQFFALPVATKNEISQFKSPQFRGYSRLGGELTNGSIDWREQIDIGPERQVIDGADGYWRLQGPNLWPAEPPGLREAFERWDAALSGVGLRLLRHWAVSLGADDDVFDAAFAELPATLIKVVRYPGTAETSQGVGAHKDSGVLTLLLVEPESEGLQVERGDDEWIDVPPGQVR